MASSRSRALKTVLGQPSWRVASRRVEAYVTRTGGHMGPVVFDRRGRKIAKVALARKPAVRLYWMWRKQSDYEQLRNFGSHAGQPESCNGVQ